MASCPSRTRHQFIPSLYSRHIITHSRMLSSSKREIALLPNDDVLPTADAFTECFEENLLPNGAFLPNSTHRSVSPLYQFLVLIGRRPGPRMGWVTGLGRPAWAHPGPVASHLCPMSVPESSRSFPLLHVGTCRQFLSELDVAPCPARFNTFLSRSSEFVIFSGLVPGLLGVKFALLHDLYGASRSCHKVLDELIPKVLLSTSKSCINTKLQNRHARMNLLYQGG
jgi:hypothetical protein